MAATPVTFWFDVSCPFCWLTSRWVKEVEKVRDIEVDWVPMSLSVLNEGRDIPQWYARKMEANWGPARVFTKVKQDFPEKVDELYTAMGTLVHPGREGGKEGFGGYDSVIERALAQVGLPAELAAAANTDANDAALRAFHQQAMDEVGDDVGTPIMKIGETAFFGPVITKLPTGEEAGKLFDASLALAEYPHFFELKRSRTENPDVRGTGLMAPEA